MTQASFNFDEQQENLERVTARIGRAVIAFLEGNRRFHADDLRRYVVRETGVAAPASADRVLRQLRLQGHIDYRVISRRESLYEVIRIGGKEIGVEKHGGAELPAEPDARGL